MKVLFVRGGNRGVDPISTKQGDSLQVEGVEIFYYDIKRKGFLGYLRNISKVRDATKQYNIDIIHAHYSFCGIMSSLAFTGKPIVTSLMGSDVLSLGLFSLWIIKFFSKLCWAKTIVKSDQMFNKLANRNALILPNGVNISKFYPDDKTKAQIQLHWDTRFLHILFASDPLREEKNYSLAESAVSFLKRDLKQTIELHCLNAIPPDSVYKYYQAADVVLLTSKYEGSPNVIKEAMACNCPIVSTDIGDVKEVTLGTENCFVTSSEPLEISRKLKTVLESGKRSNGREKILHLDSKLVALKMVKLYNSVKLEKDNDCYS